MAALVRDASLREEPALLDAVSAAAGIALENARLHAELDDDPETSSRIEHACNEIAMSLQELRDIARGLHPAVVSGHGLAVALESLTARAPVPVQLHVELEDRLPEALDGRLRVWTPRGHGTRVRAEIPCG